MTDIRISGNLLDDFADLAGHGPDKDKDPMGYLQSWGTVTEA